MDPTSGHDGEASSAVRPRPFGFQSIPILAQVMLAWIAEESRLGEERQVPSSNQDGLAVPFLAPTEPSGATTRYVRSTSRAGAGPKFSKRSVSVCPAYV